MKKASAATIDELAGQKDEILNLDHNIRAMILKALNTSCCTKRAAKRLGVTGRCLYFWKKRFAIEFDPHQKQYCSKEPAKIPSIDSADLKCKL